MELILYYIIECKDLLISFLILMFIVGTIAFLGIRNFSQKKRTKVAIYGLFSKMKTTDILKTSIVLIRTFLVFYATLTLEQTKILVAIIMMIILTIIYIVLAPKRILYETMGTFFGIAVIYFIYTLNNYSINIENSIELLYIKMLLTVFLLVFTGYLFFREIYIISADREKKTLKKNYE